MYCITLFCLKHIDRWKNATLNHKMVTVLFLTFWSAQVNNRRKKSKGIRSLEKEISSLINKIWGDKDEPSAFQGIFPSYLSILPAFSTSIPSTFPQLECKVPTGFNAYTSKNTCRHCLRFLFQLRISFISYFTLVREAIRYYPVVF